MSRERIERILLLLLIMFGAGISIYNYVYSVDMERINALRFQADLNSKKLERLKKNQGEEESYILKTQNMNREIKQIEKKIPYKKDIPGLMVELYYMLVENGLSGESVAFSSLSEGQGYNFYNISFEVKGGKKDVEEFLNQIEDFKRETSISSVDFSMENEFVLKAKIVLKVYVLKDGVEHKEEDNYDFMEGKYGSFKSVFEMFKGTNEEVSGDVAVVPTDPGQSFEGNGDGFGAGDIENGNAAGNNNSGSNNSPDTSSANENSNQNGHVNPVKPNILDQDGGANP